jgi:hypothetical protein
MVPPRALFIVLFVFLTASSVATAQFAPPNIFSAKIEDIETSSDKVIVHLRNTGERTITAFSIHLYRLKPDGERSLCSERGQDMIDWSDPMPGRGIYAHMRRNWIASNESQSLDVYPRCGGEKVPPESVQVELNLIMFDDGAGEGDPRQIEFILRNRQQARNARLKWMPRFTALRTAPDLKSSAQSLYQDLVDAVHSAEINPDDALRQGMAKPVREELQRLALEITQWASHNERLQKNELLDWRITDLEQRTARLIQGAGKTDVNPY